MKHMTQKHVKEKTWQITVERSSGSVDEYLINAVTLPEAFARFKEIMFPWNLVGISISEASA